METSEYKPIFQGLTGEGKTSNAMKRTDASVIVQSTFTQGKNKTILALPRSTR